MYVEYATSQVIGSNNAHQSMIQNYPEYHATTFAISAEIQVIGFKTAPAKIEKFHDITITEITIDIISHHRIIPLINLIQKRHPDVIQQLIGSKNVQQEKPNQ